MAPLSGISVVEVEGAAVDEARLEVLARLVVEGAGVLATEVLVEETGVTVDEGADEVSLEEVSLELVSEEVGVGVLL